MQLEHRGNYPAEWPLISEWVKRAAGWRCIRCGHPTKFSLEPTLRSIEKRRRDRESGKRYLVPPPLEYEWRVGLAPCDERCTHEPDGKLRQLTVHHTDGDKSNVYWWNLLALCQVCHLQIQAKVNPELPYLWEHSDWFKPYVAGFYAAYYAQTYLPRHEVEEMIEELLCLGQPWRSAAPS